MIVPIVLMVLAAAPVDIFDGKVHCADGRWESRKMDDAGTPGPKLAGGNSNLCFVVAEDKSVANYEVILKDVDGGNKKAPPASAQSWDLKQYSTQSRNGILIQTWTAVSSDYDEVKMIGVAENLNVADSKVGHLVGVIVQNLSRKGITSILAYFPSNVPQPKKGKQK